MNTLTILAVSVISACARASNTKYGVNLTRIQQHNGSITKNDITYTSEFTENVNDSINDCVCDIKSCVRKCCPFGEFMNASRCVRSSIDFSLDGDFCIIVGDQCAKSKHVRTLLYPHEYAILKTGQLYLNLTTSQRRYFNADYYCLDYIGDEDDIKALVCVSDKKIAPSNITGMIISMPFLLLTFIVYILLPDPNLHAKSLMCYVMALFWAYLLLVFIQINLTGLENDTNCKTIGVFCLLFFMISFVWMNVMSIDICWTFSGCRGYTGNPKEKERRRFLLYNIYALGLPLAISLLVAFFILDTSLPTDVWYHPGIGQGQCWFAPGLPSFIYFFGPLSALLTVNIVLFVITAWKVKKLQQATAILRNNQVDNRRHTSSSQADKNEFYLYLKLMLAMGINWSMEIVSWAISWQVGTVPPAVWYFTDFCNAIYGVFIFFIFVFKKSIWEMVKKRFKVLQIVEDKVLRAYYRFNQVRGRLNLGGNSQSTAESSLSEKGNVVVTVDNHNHASTAL